MTHSPNYEAAKKRINEICSRKQNSFKEYYFLYPSDLMEILDALASTPPQEAKEHVCHFIPCPVCEKVTNQVSVLPQEAKPSSVDPNDETWYSESEVRKMKEEWMLEADSLMMSLRSKLPDFHSEDCVCVSCLFRKNWSRFKQRMGV